MAKSNRHYSKEFKEEAVKLALSSVSVTSAAKELGIPDATLHTWVHTAKSQGNRSIEHNGRVDHVNVGQLINENQALKKRLARLEQEKAILKKAATYFAKELG